MKKRAPLALLGLLLAGCVAHAATGGTVRRWEASLVTLEISRQQYDYLQPWARRPATVQKSALVIGPRQLLTTASDLANRTVVRAQKVGRGLWWNASVQWIDYPANLALVTVADPDFWSNLKPVTLAEKISRDAEFQILRWRAGNLEVRRAEFNRFTVNNPSAGEAAHVLVELSSEIEGVGWAEPVLADHKVVGVVFAQLGNLIQALPSPYVRSILDAHRQGAFSGLGYFDFTWQPTENPETLRYLKVPGNSRGVVIIETVDRPGSPSPLKPRDVLLQVDNFDIDSQGDYLDPLYGHLMLEALATRNRWAGQQVRLKISRDGRAMDVDYQLPKIEDAARLVPEAPYDQEPEYLVLGGLVFEPLTRNYLRSWGQDWERNAPFRLAYFRNEDPTPERPAIVVLSLVLPDLFNLGYQDLRSLVLERVNGSRVSYLQDVEEALKHPKNGFHLFEFLPGETLQRLVISDAEVKAATRRVLERYGIEQDRVIFAEAKPEPPTKTP